MITPEFLLAIINALGIFALLTLAYGRILSSVAREPARSLVLGVLFGVGASLSIANAAEIEPGVMIDPRAVMLVLAAPFGGPLAAVVAAALTACARLWGGGIGALPGVAYVVLTAGVGFLFARFVFGDRKPGSMRDLVLLGLASNLTFLIVLVLPIPNSVEVFATAIGPLTLANTVGVVVLGQVLFSERDVFLRRVALEAEAYTDPLTNLPNRRLFERKVAGMIDGARQNDEAFSVLIADIDHFKTINDRYGHDMGDAVLVKVANTIRNSLRASDAVARFGGEEVIVAMPRSGMQEAAIVAERIRMLVDRDIFCHSPEECNVTVSIGFATMRGETITFDRLFKNADLALYRAKAGGRNQVACLDSQNPVFEHGEAVAPI